MSRIFAAPQLIGRMQSVEATATTTIQSQEFAVGLVVLLSNDGSANLSINFDRTIGQEGTLTLKPGESIHSLPITAHTLYYQAASGTVAFRAWGVL